ncbi:centromere protein I isoform X1 [Solea senegalensis]|uniref:Centromere protein I isoform X1 n=1 Tax=Solea senegalensis TaxID=28829 RepID=A0AAV6SMQ5_SOLSE|nr:centromere protein I-like isoform X1 [Solea senegalensis]KAG7518240.1 centromere protein I isoform X1 [Solea senegalensis]
MAANQSASGSSDSESPSLFDSSSQPAPNSRSFNRSVRVAEKERRKNEAEDPFVLALKFFSDVEAGTPAFGNDNLERNLVLVERVAYSKGLSPEAISVMLEFAMSLRMGTSPCVRVLKCLVPASVVPQEAVVRAMVWLGVCKIPASTQVLFIKWVLTIFDMIDAKDQLRAIYGFIFSFVTEEYLCPFVCHLLYLLTRKESVRHFRVQKLLELQSKLGRQPFLLHLLSLYKVFCPEYVTLSIPSRMKSGFRNHNSPWKSALIAVQRRNGSQIASSASLPSTIKDKTSSRKRKHYHLELPVLCSQVNKQAQTEPSLGRKLVPLVQLSSFTQLLDHMHRIELPAQMGSLLGSSLALQYLDCVQDEFALLRLNFWLGYALHEEFLFCGDGRASNSEEALQFLDKLLSTQHFLQESFSSTEVFLYKFLSVWDGSLLRPQILSLLSNIPVVPSSQIGRLLFEPLMQLFFTSSLFFKCGLIECLNSMLLKWLVWHSVYALEDDLDISLNSHTSVNMTLSGFKDSVMELVHFVGRLASVGLQLEGGHSLLLSFILDFYETVCDTFLKYGLPLIVMFPPGVFFPALLSPDPVSVDRLAYIMYRYKVNLTSAKNQEKGTEQAFHINRQTFREFNHYLVVMVSCLWNSRMFHSGMGVELGEELLLKSNVPQYSKSFDLVHHPAFLSYAVDFHHKCWPERKDLDLDSIKQSKPWSWYLEYLHNQGYDGLKQIVPAP